MEKHFETIGYRYCQHKLINSAKIVEYFKYKNILTKNHIQLIENIRQQHTLGKSNSEIGIMFGKTTSFISDTIRSFKSNRTISTPNLKDICVDKWIENIHYKSYSIFVPIKEIVEVENRLISDITVESDNHSFIAGNNFLSSNSAMGK